MKIRAHLDNTIDSVDSLKARYDKSVKEMLAGNNRTGREVQQYV